MDTIIPVNYRQHPLHISGVDIYVGGMAAPDRRNLNPDAAIEYLNQQASPHQGVLIGLKEQSFEKLANRHHLDYYHLPIPDFTAVSPQTYHQLYQYVARFTAENRPVTIHCGAGNGRTGTAIASLKLREILEREAGIQPDILEAPQTIDSQIIASMTGDRVPCSRFVKEAVESVREQRVTVPDSTNNGSGSVETVTDINALLEYENFIKNELIKERKQTLIMPLIADMDNTISHPDIERLSFVKDADDLEILLPLLTPAQCTSICKMHIDLIDNSYRLGRVLSSLNMEQFDAVCRVMQEKMPDIMFDMQNLKQVISQFNSAQLKNFIPYIPHHLVEELQHFDVLLHLIEGINFEQRAVLLETGMKFLPHMLNDTYHLITLLKHLNYQDIQHLFQDPMIREKISNLIKTSSELSNVLTHLNPELTQDFLKILNIRLPEIIKSIDDYTNLLKLNPQTEQSKVICNELQFLLPGLIKNAWVLGILLENIPSADYLTPICQQLQTTLPNIIHNAVDLNHVLDTVYLEQCQIILDGLKGKLPEIIKNVFDLRILLKKLTPEICAEVCQAYLQHHLTASDLKEVLDSLSLTQYAATLEGIQDILPQVIQTQQDFCDFFVGNSASQIQQQKLNLEKFKDILPHIIHKATDFIEIYQSLPHELHSDLIHLYKDKLPQLIRNAHDFGILVAAIEPNQYADIFSTMHSKLINIIKTPKNLNIVLDYLNPQQTEIFHQSEIISRLKQYINRIESHTKDNEIDFGYGFTAFNDSKVVNRKINYLLALELLNQLQSKSPNFACFEDIEKFKSTIVQNLSAEDKANYVERKIGSKELKEIIDISKPFKK